MKNIIKLAYVVLCTLVVSCSSFLDEKPQSDFMQEGTGTEDQESKYGSLADAQAELQVRMRVLKQIYFQSENYTIGGCAVRKLVISAEECVPNRSLIC